MPNATAPASKSEKAPVRPFDYLHFYRTPPVERIAIIKRGFSAKSAKYILGMMHLDQKNMFRALNIKTATINKKAAQNENLSLGDAERVLGLAKLLGQIEAMVEESGDPEGFDAASWLSRWLREPLPALGDAPMNFLDTMEGQTLVAQALAQMQSGAYA
ncbi:antitoxin Xre/MbcA/ParS toxin-binding domain-containing protein [Methylobacterium oryzae]|uniref:Antitoxin Xre/MbcA/ParS-like toxin-binding domain-containing protein n=1 Tax=Methylobacterium oryzae TaxID=334852 RepID=A0ABU7TTG1_9HYPH